MKSNKLVLMLATAASIAVLSGFATHAGIPAALLQDDGSAGIYVDLSHVEDFRKSDNVVLIDIRTPDRYAAGHIPGAINIPRERVETPVLNGVIGETKPLEELEPILAAAGLKYDDRVIVYGEKDDGQLSPTSGRYAGKIYVSLDQAGFDSVHILNGGVESWQGELSTEATVLPASDLKLTKSKPIIVDKDYVLNALGREKESVFVLDARGTKGFDEGHIKGSYNIPIGLFSDANTLNESVDDLVARLEEIGVAKDSEIITTCGWGWAASDALAVLKDLGYTNIRLYDGSWTEWVQDPKTPKAGANFDNI
ncbi:rhodanese-like domain-containing protein [Mesorhizobium sp. CAU 1732]|uniref:sulfurtransferase n=1 Tax=Mesorhizobium sp. CAU 1732 TaxID=3140358 RepID=UPI0032602CF3